MFQYKIVLLYLGEHDYKLLENWCLKAESMKPWRDSMIAQHGRPDKTYIYWGPMGNEEPVPGALGAL